MPTMREAGYEVAVTSQDAPMLKDVGYDVFLDDAEIIEVGKVRLHAIHNPGHTPGSLAFVVRTPTGPVPGTTYSRTSCRAHWRAVTFPQTRPRSRGRVSTIVVSSITRLGVPNAPMMRRGASHGSPRSSTG
jgi:hypothetical protein